MQVVCYPVDPPYVWDDRLYTARQEAGLCQSTYWARVLQQVDDATSLFLEVRQKEEVIASLLVFHKRPWDRQAMHTQIGLNWLNGAWRGWLEWLDGPVFYTDHPEDVKTTLAVLLTWIDNYIKEKQLVRVSGAFSVTSHWSADEGIRALFSQFGYISNRWGTYLVDLTQEESLLWRNLDKAARKCVKKAQASSVKITQIHSLNALERRFYQPYRQIEAAYKRNVNPFSVAEAMWQEDRLRYYKYFIAEGEDKEVLAIIGMYIFNGIATEISSALSPKAYEQKIPAQDLLHWEMLLAAKKAGCHTFNLAGVNPNPSNAKEAGIRQFKAKWGGTYVEYNRFEKQNRINLCHQVNGYIRNLHFLRQNPRPQI